MKGMLRNAFRLFCFMLALAPAGASHALELVFFSRPGCVYCARFERDVAPIYLKSDEGKRAPLRQWDLSNGDSGDKLAYPVRYTPTFVLVEKGAEIGRITGFINDDMFWGLLGKMLKDLPPETGITPARTEE